MNVFVKKVEKNSMLKSCKYCGKIHDGQLLCSFKPPRKKQKNKKDKFRSTSAWQKKREEIQTRDFHLCQVCKAENKYTCIGLEVHHILSLQVAFDLRLENENLITLCEYHHKLAERSEISMKYLQNLINHPTPKGGESVSD